MALSISRRSFMKCVGITAFATATGTLMTGCAQGPVMGDFGGSFPLYELNDATPLLNITLTGLDWSPFDITLGQIASEVEIDLPFSDLNLSFISTILGYGCAMPKGLIENKSDKTLIVLPYFTGDLLDQAFNEFVRPKIKENKTTIEGAIKTLLDNNSDKLAEELHTLIKTEVGDWLNILLVAVNSAIKLFKIDESEVRSILKDGKSYSTGGFLPITITVPGLNDLKSDQKQSIVDGIRSLIDTYLPQATDIFRLLMVQGICDGKQNASTTDQLLNAAAAGYSRYKAQNPLMLDVINARSINAPSSTVGVLGIPAKRNWHSMELIFATKKLNLSLAENYPLEWNNVLDLLVETLIYLIYNKNASTLALPLCNIILPLVDSLQISLSNEGGQVGLSFQNTSIF